MQAIDVISGVELEVLDTVCPQEWQVLLTGIEGTDESNPNPESVLSKIPAPVPGIPGDGAQATAGLMPSSSSNSAYQSLGETSIGRECVRQGTIPSPACLSAIRTVEWITQTLLVRVPVSVRPLVEDSANDNAITYWEHTWYRRAIQDTRHLGSRKPFRCGGLRGYDQLQVIVDHLATRQAEQGLDPYLSKLQACAQRAVELARPLVDDVRQAKEWVVRIERLLADVPIADGMQPLSAIQRQRMRDLLTECENQQDVGITVRRLQRTWRGMLDRWETDLYHWHDIVGLPRSNLGVEALLGQARRQQRRLCGQADTSSLAVTGQGYLWATSAGQLALLEMFCQVPTWVYRLALRCVEAVEAGIRWPKQLHRNTAKALQQFQTQADALRKRVAAANSSP